MADPSSPRPMRQGLTNVKFEGILMIVMADNTPLLKNPAAVDDKIYAVDSLVIEEEFHGVNNILRCRESAAGCTRAHRLEHLRLVFPCGCIADDARMYRVEADRRQFDSHGLDHAADGSVHHRDRCGAGIRSLARETATYGNGRVLVHTIEHHMDDFRIANELDGHGSPRFGEVVIPHRVGVALDRNDQE